MNELNSTQLFQLDCEGCNECRYSAIDRETLKEITFNYYKCDVDKELYFFHYKDIRGQFALGQLQIIINKLFKDIRKVSCSCE